MSGRYIASLLLVLTFCAVGRKGRKGKLMRVLSVVLAGLLGNIAAAPCEATPPILRQPRIDFIQSEKDGGLFAMVDSKGLYHRAVGQDWKNVLPDPVMAWSRIHQRSEGEWLLSPQFGGPVYISRDQGAKWIASGIAAIPVEYDKLSGGERERLVAVTKKGRAYMLVKNTLFASSDGGNAWHTHQIPDLRVSDSAFSQSIAASDTDVFVLSGHDLFRSKDQGVTWETVEQKDGTSPIKADIDNRAPTLRMAPDGALLALGPSGGNQRIFVSRDSGHAWTEERFGLPTGAAVLVRIYEPDPDAIYFFVRNEAPTGPTFRTLYRKDTDGRLMEMHVDPSLVGHITRSNNGRIYMLTMQGKDVFESVDDGKNWSPVSRTSIAW